MIKRMLINAASDELRVAITEDARLIDLDIEIPGQEQKKANIYKGVISSIEPSLGAVFVKYSNDRHGFLPFKEVSPEYYLNHHNTSPSANLEMNEILKVGQELVVQVVKEERGTKGAAITTYISLPGAFLVLMPNNPTAGGISRRIEGEDREELRSIINELKVPEGMSVIIRTAGVGRSKNELEWDLTVLLHYWEAIKQAAVAKPGTYLIHQESDVLIRAIRDYLRQDMHEIIVDEPQAYERAKHYISQVRPDYLDRLKLYTDHLPLFSHFQIEQQIENAYQREVRLVSGGALVIDHTEALVTIDVNSSRATGGGDIEETALQTNLEAADEVARQMRIRDIGGLVVIDFIDMTPIRNQREVENRLRNALRLDRARVQIGRISRFGLLEMSRQRLRTSLAGSMQALCPRCNGRGTIRGVESLGSSMIHLIQEQASKAQNMIFQIQLPIDIATFLLNEKRPILEDIEQRCQVKITIIPNQYLDPPQYQIKQLKYDLSGIDQTKVTPSYKVTKEVKMMPAPAIVQPITKAVDAPAIQQFLSDEPIAATAPTTARKPETSGLFKRLMSKMFGNDGQSASGDHTKTGLADKNQGTSSHSRSGGQTREDSRSQYGRRPPQRRIPATSQRSGGARRGSRGGQQQRYRGNAPSGPRRTPRPPYPPENPGDNNNNNNQT